MVGRCKIEPGWIVLVRFGDLLEEDALSGIIGLVEGELVVVIFAGVDCIFGEAEPVGPPGLTVS